MQGFAGWQLGYSMLPEITGGCVRYDKIAFVLFPVGSPGFLRFLRFQTVTGGLRADIAQKVALQFLNPLNAGKKKEEALSLLKKWFPQMENFSGQLKKYKVTINDLLAENEQLEARAKASEKGKMKDTMERAKLESELHDIQRLVDRIPPEVLAELKRQQRHTREW